MSSLVEIRQTPDASARTLGLDKYQKSKMPGTFDVLQPAKTPDGRWVTGLDEKAITVSRINDPILREERHNEIKELREELERVTGLDLSGTSNYWNTYYVKIVEKLALNFDNPNDKIKYFVLLANDYSAPELESISSPDFVNTKYYMHRAEQEDEQKSLKSRERDKSVAELYAMYDKPEKLKLIAKYVLGSRIKDTLSKDSTYNLVREGLLGDKDGSLVRKFNEAIGKTIEELQYKLIIDEAIQKHVIRLRDGYYQRGNATYGKTMKDVLKYISSPENANEFGSIKEEVEEKRSLG